MAAPTNISAATAVELGTFPNTIIQDVNDSGTTYTVWYKYTVQPGDFEIGVWAFGDLTTYLPQMTVYADDGVTQILDLFDILNVPAQIPVGSNTVVYFKVVSSTGNVAAASLTISGQQAPTLDTPAGSLLINDDSIGYPGVIVSQSSATVLKFIDVVSGELGDSLVSGIFMLNDQNVAGRVVLYAADYSLIANIDIPTTPSVDVIRSDRSDFFYVAAHKSSVRTLYKIDVTGSIVQTWTLGVTGTIWTMAPSRDGTVMYYSLTTGLAANSTVQHYNLSTNTDLGVLIAADSPYFVTQDLLVCSDGTLLVGYKKSFPDFNVKHFDASGTLLNTYPFGAVISVGTLDYRLCLTTDDGESFWSKTFATDLTEATLQRIQVSDGSVLESFTIVSFESGIYTKAATATPTHFGPSESCPLLTVGVGSASTGTIVVTKTTPGLTGITTTFPFGASGGLSPSSFSLTSGTSYTFPSVATGTGYAIAETAPSGWTVDYTVSNGSDVNNISVSEGETVTVTVANTVTHTTRTDPVRRLRQTAHLSDEQVWLFFSKFQLDCETGVGLNNGQGVDPQVMLSWSDDGGHTWSPERWVSAGKQGEYKRRAIWRRLGRSRDRVWRIVVSDPVAWRLLAAYIDVAKGTS